MKLIQLTQGQFAMVDDDVYDDLNKYKWYANSSNKYFRAIRNIRINGKYTTVKLHRVIMSAQKGDIIDHIDGDTLNNQRSNLRFCTNSQNQHNSKINSNSTTGYKGTTPHGKGYKAQIQHNGKPVYLGSRSTPEEAYELYKEASKKYHGEFGRVE